MAIFNIHEANLDSEQEDILDSLSSSNEVNLVSGPPGCGKTLLAFHLYKKVHQNYNADNDFEEAEHLPLASLIMHNRVLRSYIRKELVLTASDEEITNVEVMHYYENFLRFLWNGAFGKSNKKIPTVKDRININNQRYYSRIDTKAFFHEISCLTKQEQNSFHFGHLIIDEGQDFPRDFFFLMNAIRSLWPENQPAITVFADENQIINEQNSTIEEMLKSLSIDESNHKKLTNNYRNTKQIYKFASHFKTTDQKTNKPSREGQIPKVILKDSENDIPEYILQLTKENKNKSFLLVIGSRAGRKSFNSILSRVKTMLQTSRSEVHIDGYRSLKFNESYNGAIVVHEDDLHFDEGNIVQVYDASSKGIEADIVIYVGPEFHDCSNDEIQVKQKLYVTSTRAKEQLHIIITGNKEDEKIKAFLNLLPKEKGIFQIHA